MKKLLRVTTGISWMPPNSEGRLYHTDELPRPEVWATAFAFAFVDDQMLLTRLAKRGWDIPGGHLEPGETPAQAAVRETIEEAGVVVEPMELIGVQELEVFGLLPPSWTRPISTQVFFLCRVVEMLPFHPTEEALERGFFNPCEMRVVPTLANHDLLYEIALQRLKA